jgi:transposase
MHLRTSEFKARRSKPQDHERDRQGNSRHERRMQAGRLLLDGMRQAQVARAVGVTRKAVSLWNRQLVAAGGLCGLQGRPRGRRAGLNAQQRAELVGLLMNGALAQGFNTELWTVRRVRQLIEERFRRCYSASQVYRILVALGFNSCTPTEVELRRDGAAIRRWKLSATSDAR